MKAELLMLAVCLSFSTTAVAQTQAGLPDSAAAIPRTEIEAAIAHGKNGKPPFGLGLGTAASGLAGSMARKLNAGYAVYVQGPAGRISQAAYQAKRRYTTFTIDSVSSWMASPLVTVFVEPAPPTRLPSGEMDENPGVDHVVLTPNDGQPIQPIKTEPIPVEWQNLMGATFSSRGIVAYFDRAQMPTTDFRVVIIPTSGAEMRYQVKAKDLGRVK